MAQPRIVPINVSSRVLRHISRGIYRTPAGAVKEIISNSYDAGAKQVTVKTGWPSFREMVFTDDGSGMDEKEFVSLIQRIGFSDKTAGEAFKVPGVRNKRVTIGHYGIGLLAMGQLAKRMTIRSKKSGTRTGFEAELDFDQFEGFDAEGVGRSRVKDEAEFERGESGGKKSSLPIGTCKIRSQVYPASASKESFTRIELTNLRDEVVKKLRGTHRDRINPKANLFQEYSATYEELLRLLREKEGNAKQGFYPYEKLIWELGAYCPVPYPPCGEFAEAGRLAVIAGLASRYHFNVTIDGMELRKPFEAKFFKDEAFKSDNVWSWHDEPYGRRRGGPRASGYLIYKRTIRPKAIQGILIREGGVAIGLYDTTYLEYPYNEGQKFNQMTGELYVEGLSGALNIDRNSFNETDDRYLDLCQWFHGKLRTEVFSKLKKLQKDPRSKQRRETQRLLVGTLSAVARQLGKRTDVTIKALGADRPLICKIGRAVVINSDHPDGQGSSTKREKVLLAGAMVLHGAVSPSQLAEIEDAIDAGKREMKKQ
ncbi:MAG: ATP-binding protein [Planctomycetes bacterium]|nr:ATP-binding protein [Planctomycetota bacterium]